MAGSRKRNQLAALQSTIYVDHNRQPNGGAPYAEELHDLTHGVIEVLATTLVSSYRAHGPIQPVKRGSGLNQHTFHNGWPIVRPCVIATTPAKKSADPVRRHYGYNSDDFDQFARWTGPFEVVWALEESLRRARKDIVHDKDRLQEIAAKDEELEEVIRAHTNPLIASDDSGGRADVFVSSYRLASLIAGIGRDILVRECSLLGLEDHPALPTIEFCGLELEKSPTGLIYTRFTEPGV